MARLNRFAFNGGELSDWLSPRVDLEKYHSGCERLRNMQVVRYGGARRRSGSVYAATTKSGKVRLQGFDFGRTAGVIVELGAQYARFYRSGASYGQVAATGITAWATGTSYAGGVTVSHGGSNYVSLSAHTSGAGTEPGVGGSWTDQWHLLTGSIYEIPTPWLEAELFEVQFAQRNDVIVATHRNHQARLLSRYAEAQWTIETAPWTWRPWRTLNSGDTTMQPSATTGAGITITASADTFDAAWVNSRLRLLHFADEEVYNRTLDWAWNPATYDAAFAAGDAMVAFNPANTYDTTEPGAANPSRVQYNAAGTLLDPCYRCILNYTPAVWQLTGGAAYALNDIATHGGSSYVCILAHTSAGGGGTDEPGTGATWETYWDLVTSPADAPNHFARGVVVAGPVTVAGGWEFETSGTWDGGWRIERSYDGGTNWQTLKTMETESVANFTTSGEEDADTPALFRLLVISSSAAGYTAPVFFRVFSREVTGKALITGYTSATQVTATVETDFAATTATKDWSEDAYNDRNGYASACGFHEERLWLGGSTRDPQVLYGSQTEDYFNFRQGTDDDEAVSFALNSNEYQEICWLLSQRALLVGTTGSEWVLRTTDEAPLTPSNAQAFLHTSVGSAPRQAMVVQDRAVYLQRGSRKLIEMGGNQFDGFSGRDLTVLAEHVTRGQVVQTAQQRNLDNVLHAVNGNGELAGMVYERAEAIAAWHRWDSPAASGLIESVACCYGHNEEDEVWMSVQRTINGSTVRCVERIVPDLIRQEEAGAGGQDNLVFTDCSVTYSGAATTSITGLSHLEGETVQVLADGYDAGDFTVSGGAITLGTAASTVTVGLGYTSELRPMPYDDQGVVGYKKSVPHLLVRFRLSLSCEAGDHLADRWNTIPFRAAAEDPNEPPLLKTETVSVTIANQHERSKSATLRQTRPLPMTVLAILPAVGVGTE